MTRFPVEKDPAIARIVRPFQEFARAEASGGLVLIACTALALLWANSPWAGGYAAFWQHRLTIGPDALSISKPLLLWVNDGLMAVFFFMVGLEIKRELLVGELASPRRAALPIAAAIGGMIVPALIFFAFTRGTPEARGWGVPMATDIAFALGVIALLGDRIPVPLRVFIAAAAIVDDLGAVLVIAIFYSSGVSGRALAAAGVFCALLAAANLLGVRRTVVYLVLGVGLWVAVLKSGVHATLAGVLLAMAIPARVRIDAEEYATRVDGALGTFRGALPGDEREAMETRQAAVNAIERACEQVGAPLLRLEHVLVGWVAFAIVPIFALANAGVDLRTGLGSALASRAGLGIIAGLVAGKAIGITLFSWLAVRLGIAALPPRVGWGHIAGTSLVAGIGFTMSIFIAALAFGEGGMLNTAKAAILAASLVAGILGYVTLRAVSRAG